MKKKANLKEIILMSAAGLGLFGTQSANAQTHDTLKNYDKITGVTNIFGYNGTTYGVWPEKKITSEEGKCYYLKGDSWISESGEVMPKEFNEELKKADNAVYLKSKKNNSRIVGYFPFFHTPSKQKNTVVIYSDGTSAVGNFFFDLDQQGAFYDENKNGQRDSKEQEMSDRFTELYYQKLKELVNEKKAPSSWIFPPLNEQERLAIALQARDYEDQSAHKKLLNTFTDINLLSTKSINQNNQNELKNISSKITAEIDGVKIKVDDIDKKYDKKLGELDKKLDSLEISQDSQDQKTTFYDDFELKGNISKHSEEIKKNSEKISELEDKLTQMSTTTKTTERVVEKVVEKEYIENNYDDSLIKQEISQIKDKLKVLEPLEGLAGIVKQIDEEGARKMSEQGASEQEATSDQAQEQAQEQTPSTPQTQTQQQTPSQTSSEQGKTEETKEGTKILPITNGGASESSEEGTQNTNNNKKSKPLPIPIVRKPGLYVIAGPEIGLNSQGKYDSAGANLGFRYEFSDTLGIGATSSFSMHESIIIDQYREVLNPLKNIYAQGQTTAENRNSFSPRLELRLGPFLFGIGGKFSYWIQETKEQIMKDGKELRSNISASGKNSSSLEYHVGLNIPIKENFGIEGILGYNEEAGTSFGLRGTIKLGGSDKPKNKQPKNDQSENKQPELKEGESKK